MNWCRQHIERGTLIAIPACERFFKLLNLIELVQSVFYKLNPSVRTVRFCIVNQPIVCVPLHFPHLISPLLSYVSPVGMTSGACYVSPVRQRRERVGDRAVRDVYVLGAPCRFPFQNRAAKWPSITSSCTLAPRHLRRKRHSLPRHDIATALNDLTIDFDPLFKFDPVLAATCALEHAYATNKVLAPTCSLKHKSRQLARADFGFQNTHRKARVGGRWLQVTPAQVEHSTMLVSVPSA
ncbi:hypothetical protein V8E53_001604 [Lactarius tabidus]